MSPREMLVSETREWLDRARGDYRACDALIAAGLPAEALFHAQQCAEKAMKALLVWHQIPFKKTHDLDELKQALIRGPGTGARGNRAPIPIRLAIPLSRRAACPRQRGSRGSLGSRWSTA